MEGNVIEKLIFSAFILSSFHASAFAIDHPNTLSQRIHKALSDRLPYAEVRIPNLEKLSQSQEIRDLKSIADVRVIEDRSNGVAILDLIGDDGASVRIQTPYQAFVNAPVANRKILPNTRIKAEDFRVEKINVAVSPAREYRGSMVTDLANLENSETRQTILEAQFVVSSAIQRSPDVRKGEMIKLQMVSGDLSLTTAATVLENGSIGDRVRVLTSRTKKEVVGKIKSDHTIEVNL